MRLSAVSDPPQVLGRKVSAADWRKARKNTWSNARDFGAASGCGPQSCNEELGGEASAHNADHPAHAGALEAEDGQAGAAGAVARGAATATCCGVDAEDGGTGERFASARAKGLADARREVRRVSDGRGLG